LLLVSLALLLVLAGCSSDSEGPSYSVALPDASSLGEYSGSESEPTSGTEAKASATKVDAALNSEINNIGAAIASTIEAAATESEQINEVLEVGGGTITVTGTETYTYPDDPNATSGTITFATNYDGDVEGVSVDADTSNPETSTVNGTIGSNYTASISYQETGQSSGTLSISIVGQIGWALSISSDEPGVGSGKYILLINVNGSDTVTFDETNSSTNLEDNITISGVVRVYNNSNELLFEENLTQEEIASTNSLFDFYF
jgi:hypothetical protein